MYLEYWNLDRNPFDNVPDPNMYFPEHSTVEGTVAELLFAIEEANECLAVVVGEVGLGKTMSLRMVLNELDHSLYKVAYVTNPDVTFNQLLRDIVGQLRGVKSEIRNREDLLEEFNSILFQASDQDAKVLVFIDESNSLRPESLEGLRLLTNMQEDDKNLFTLVLAGQPKLTKMLRDPRRVNIYQRIGVFCSLEAMDSVEVVESYISHRLAVAGGSLPVFDRSGFEAVFERSSGIPRLVNRLCKLSMKAAETNNLRLVTGELVHDIADRFSPLEHRSIPAVRRAGKIEIQSTPTQADVRAFPREAVAAGQIEKERLPEPGEFMGNPATLQELPVDKAPDQQLSPGKPGSASAPQPVKKKIHLMGVSQKSIFQLKDMSNPRDKLRFAGLLAAKELKINPERFEGIDSDPVRIWDDLRRAIIEAV